MKALFVKHISITWLLVATGLLSFTIMQWQEKPTLYVIGDSTVQNSDGNGKNEYWGWGSLLYPYIDTNLLRQRKKIFESLLSREKIVNPVTEEAKQDLNDLSKEEGKMVITAKDEAFLKKVIEIVEREMTDTEFNVDKLAEKLLMGRTTFFKKFKSLTNTAPVEYIRDTRLRVGKQMLDAGEDNIGTIAFETGFGSTKYFSACFKEKYEVLPSEYVKFRINHPVNT
ncbi:MAG: helix-turn-helix domain-containing protein [Chitinophagaceae bacterium]